MQQASTEPVLGDRPVANWDAGKSVRRRAFTGFHSSIILVLLGAGCGGMSTSHDPKVVGMTCATAGCDPMATCQLSGDQVICACPAGFTDPNGHGKTCVDTDECATPGTCSPSATCTNTPGSYTCACKPGFSGNGTICNDVNECSSANGGCDINARCTNLIGSRTCECNEGYQGDGTYCIDFDECASNNGGCGANAFCTNTQGGRECTCQPGYRGDGLSCVDIDECATKTAKCDANVACSNTPGSYTCGGCPAGYAGGGSVCIDINECAFDNGGCDKNAVCANTQGSYTCTCKAGYSGNGIKCVDSDACAKNPCGAGFTCTDLPAPVGDGPDGRVCGDVNECAVNNGGCPANTICSNANGVRTCTCRKGYQGDGIICTDVNECLTNNGGCGANAFCTNFEGGRMCSCAGGFAGDGLNCYDVDECAISNGGCHKNAACTNTQGGRTCACNTGYEGSGTTCTDINECTTNNGGCHANATCTNTPGSRTCACNQGFGGTGLECSDIMAPTPGTALAFTSVTSTSLTVSWGRATDNVTAQSSLQYKLVKASSAGALASLSLVDAITGGDLLVDWTADAITANVNGLTTVTTYYFAVLVKDAAGNKAMYGVSSTGTLDDIPPSVGTITFAAIEGTCLTVNWTTANDNVTSGADLEYKLVRAAASASIDTVNEIDAITGAGAGLVMDWTANTLTWDVTGLAEATTYYFAVLVRDEAGNKAVYTPASATTLDATAPTVGTAITFSNVSARGMTVSWGAATDAVTAQASLQYKLVSGASIAALDTVDEADEATTILNWSTNTLSNTRTGLTDSTTYYYAVLVRDAAGNRSLYSPASQATLAPTSLNCGGGKVAVGVYGNSGWLLDRIGIRCADFDGTTVSTTISNGPSAGGDGGGPFTYDCPAGAVLHAVRGGNGASCSSSSTSYMEAQCIRVIDDELLNWSSKYGEANPFTCPHTGTFSFSCGTDEYATGVKVDATGTGTFVGFTMGINCSSFSQDPPQLTSLDPTSGDMSTAIDMTLRGVNFTQDSVVYFDGQSVSTVVVGSTELSAQIASSLTGQAGQHSLWVGNAPATISNTLYFTVLPAADAPVIVDYNPDNGVAGDSILIIGRNLTSEPITITGPDSQTVAAGSTGTTTWWTETLQTVQFILPSGWQTGAITVSNTKGSSRGKTFNVGQNLVRLSGVVVTSSTQYSASWPTAQGADHNLATSWFSASGDCATNPSCTSVPWFSVTFPTAQTVGRIAMRGNREYPSGYDYIRGTFEIRGASDVLLWSAAYTLPEPDRDLDIVLPTPVADAVKVRFISLQDESVEPGFAELEVF